MEGERGEGRGEGDERGSGGEREVDASVEVHDGEPEGCCCRIGTGSVETRVRAFFTVSADGRAGR